ncbi:hypothetical protein BC629DRAFT_1540321 [Irpex lacteus]|nr:hypothetical protein BC629DRAFT_1540321 [Irpex lacteus]
MCWPPSLAACPIRKADTGREPAIKVPQLEPDVFRKHDKSARHRVSRMRIEKLMNDLLCFTGSSSDPQTHKLG